LTLSNTLIGNSAKFRKFGGVVAITEASEERLRDGRRISCGERPCEGVIATKYNDLKSIFKFCEIARALRRYVVLVLWRG
jgi:hypothetical protein